MVALGFAETVGVAVVNLLGCSPVYGALHSGSPCISRSCVPVAGDGLLKHPKAAPGRLALLSYQQLEVPAADEGLLELAGRNAALLAPLLYDADLAAGRVPGMRTNGVAGVYRPSIAAETCSC